MAVAEPGNGWAAAFYATYRLARRIVIAVVGTTVLLLGAVLLVTPGPAFVVIPIGLGILAIEFSWARRWLKHVKQAYAGVRNAYGGAPSSSADVQRRQTCERAPREL
ncbi:MAG TPA: PGPGW domain-containing protein [Candidatus Binatia bacterium]